MDFLTIAGLIILTVILYLIYTVVKPANFPPDLLQQKFFRSSSMRGAVDYAKERGLSPWRLPVVGNTFLIKKLSQQLGGQYIALLKLSKDFKTDILGLKLGNQQYVVVFGRKLVQEVFTRDEFQGRPDGFFIRLRTMGSRRGITMTDGPLWQEQRNFTERKLRQFGFGKMVMENLMANELHDLLESLDEKKENISLNEKTSSSVLNVLWTITGGKQFSKEENRLGKLLSLLRERGRAFDMAGGILNQIPWLRFIMPEYSGYTCIKKLNSELFELCQEIIDEHKRTLTAETRDFVDAYLHEVEQSRTGNFTDDQLVAICLDFFIASGLTTSYTLDFAILATISNPHVQVKLHEEIDKVLPRGQLPSLADKAKLPYVEALLLESQRFQHVVPTAGPRRTLRDTTLAGYNIPKDTIMLMSLRSVHYDRERFDDVDEFKPERFLTPNGEMIPDEGLCPFGIGKRRCPGEVLAKSFLFLAFTALFQKYQISFPEGKEPSSQKPKAGILLTPQPYTVSLKSR